MKMKITVADIVPFFSKSTYCIILKNYDEVFKGPLSAIPLVYKSYYIQQLVPDRDSIVATGVIGICIKD